MKVKHLILLLTVLLYTVAVAGREFVSVRFSESEFSFTRNSFNCINIVPANPISSYGEDVSKPALPLFPVNVLLPEGTSYKGIKVSVSKKLIMKDVNVAPVPAYSTTDNNVVFPPNRVPDYLGYTYPSENVSFVGTSSLDNSNMVRFLVCPFLFDSAKKELYLLEKIDMEIETAGNPVLKSKGSSRNGIMKDILDAQVYNAAAFTPFEDRQIIITRPNNIDYLLAELI